MSTNNTAPTDPIQSASSPAALFPAPETATEQTGAPGLLNAESPSVEATLDSTPPVHPDIAVAEQFEVNAIPGDVTTQVISGSLQSAIEMLAAGGPIVWILLVLSIFALSVILIKAWHFMLVRPEGRKRINSALDHWRDRDPELAMSALRSSHPIQSIVLQAMSGVREQKDTNLLQTELSRQANAVIHDLRSYLRPLEIIASLSPLLGLMGTVVGMIIAFQQMEMAGSQVDPSVLSGGIWQALLTTAAGLAVAIPVAAAHSYFERKVERIGHLLNDAVTRVFTIEQETIISNVKHMSGKHAA